MNDRTQALLDAGYRYALALRCQRADAEDLVQEAWVRLHERVWPPITRGRLLRTIRNLFIDRYRREQLFVSVPLDPEDAGLASEPTLLERHVPEPELEGALTRLRAPEREALFLNVVEGYTAREIAALTSQPRGTVLSLIHRAKQQLRQALEAGYSGARGAEGGQS